MYKVYEVVNKLNGKTFVGKTTFTVGYITSILKTKKKNTSNKAMLIEDIRKIGIDNFEISIVKEFDSPNDQHNFHGVYLTKKGSNVYNMRKISTKDETIIAAYNEHKNINKVSRMLDINVSTVYICLRRWGIDTVSKSESVKTMVRYNQYSEVKKTDTVKVYARHKTSDETLEFENIIYAAEYFLPRVRTKRLKEVIRNLRVNINNKSASCYGYIITQDEENTLDTETNQ